MLDTETTGIKLLPKIIVLNPKDGGVWMARFKGKEKDCCIWPDIKRWN